MTNENSQIDPETQKIIKERGWDHETSKAKYLEKITRLGAKPQKIFNETGYSESAKDIGEGMSNFYEGSEEGRSNFYDE